MVHLQILSGRRAGEAQLATRFPLRVGRGETDDLRIDEAGVWDSHCEIALDPDRGFLLRVRPSAWVLINGTSTQETFLRSGDILEVGPVRLQFWLGEARQKSLRAREIGTWVLLVFLGLIQLALVFWLLRS